MRVEFDCKDLTLGLSHTIADSAGGAQLLKVHDAWLYAATISVGLLINLFLSVYLVFFQNPMWWSWAAVCLALLAYLFILFQINKDELSAITLRDDVRRSAEITNEAFIISTIKDGKAIDKTWYHWPQIRGYTSTKDMLFIGVNNGWAFEFVPLDIFDNDKQRERFIAELDKHIPLRQHDMS